MPGRVWTMPLAEVVVGEITVFETHPLIQMDEYLDAEKKRGACPGCLAGNRGNTRENILHAPTAEALAGSAGGKERQDQQRAETAEDYQKATRQAGGKRKERAWLMEQ